MDFNLIIKNVFSGYLLYIERWLQAPVQLSRTDPTGKLFGVDDAGVLTVL